MPFSVFVSEMPKIRLFVLSRCGNGTKHPNSFSAFPFSSPHFKFFPFGFGQENIHIILGPVNWRPKQFPILCLTVVTSLTEAPTMPKSLCHPCRKTSGLFSCRDLATAW